MLDGFFKVNKAEVSAMCLTEYDEEATMRAFRKEGYEDGRADGYTEGRTNGLAEGERKKAVEAAVMLISDFNVEPQLAAEKMNAPLDKVLEALKLQA